jgi:hypothetical protein
MYDKLMSSFSGLVDVSAWALKVFMWLMVGGFGLAVAIFIIILGVMVWKNFR